MVMGMKSFTFVVLTYNHEKFIEQHLESIRYQIEHFASPYEIHLIISDDASSDGTLNIVNNWLLKWSDTLFRNVQIITHDTNVGTCKNFVSAIKRIKSNYFKCLAGDDLYYKTSVFDVVKLLDEYDVVYTLPYVFGEEKHAVQQYRQTSAAFSCRSFRQNQDKQKDYLISPPFSCGHFYRLPLFTDTLLDYVSEFKLIEDRSTWIKLYEENENLKIYYYDKCIVMYRMNPKSVLHTRNQLITESYSKDYQLLGKYQEEQCAYKPAKLYHHLMRMNITKRIYISTTSLVYKLKLLIWCITTTVSHTEREIYGCSNSESISNAHKSGERNNYD